MRYVFVKHIGTFRTKSNPPPLYIITLIKSWRYKKKKKKKREREREREREGEMQAFFNAILCDKAHKIKVGFWVFPFLTGPLDWNDLWCRKQETAPIITTTLDLKPSPNGAQHSPNGAQYSPNGAQYIFT